MIKIRNILCPVDFSSFSRHALVHAVLLARWYEATLTVFHAYPDPAEPPPMVFAGFAGIVPIEPIPRLTVSPVEVHSQIIAELKRLTESVGASEAQVRFDARPGNAVRGILDHAHSLHADLIVLGTHGHGGFERWVLGSVAEKVLRKASCPVFTVPPRVAEPVGDPLLILKRILCAVDFSDSSLKALEYSLSLAQEADAELLMVHVIEGVPDVRHWKQPDRWIVEYLRTSEQQALDQLRAAIPQDAHTWCRPEALLATRKPYQEILRIARERDIHLIVIGVHGRNPVDLMFFGSTTHQVVRAATCPVLTLRA